MKQLADEALTLGFRELAITGGEPFLERHLPETVARLAQRLPVIVLSNGTLFAPALVERLRPFAELPVKVQLSLDSADAKVNDAYRGGGNFARVLEAIVRLQEIGLRVRIASTVEDPADSDLAALCELHRSLGIDDEDHVVRPVIRRGRAIDQELGLVATFDQYPPELTVTADGAFWSPAAPTVFRGRLDIDMLLTRTITPLAKPAEVMLRLIEGRPAGASASAIT